VGKKGEGGREKREKAIKYNRRKESIQYNYNTI